MALFSSPKDSEISHDPLKTESAQFKAPAPRPAATVIAKGVKVDGDFGSDGDVVIDGEVKGNLSATGQLTVGAEAVIRADVKAGTAIVSGTIEGNLTVDKRIDLKATARIKGDLVSETLSVESGARIDGKLSIGAKSES